MARVTYKLASSTTTNWYPQTEALEQNHKSVQDITSDSRWAKSRVDSRVKECHLLIKISSDEIAICRADRLRARTADRVAAMLRGRRDIA